MNRCAALALSALCLLIDARSARGASLLGIVHGEDGKPLAAVTAVAAQRTGVLPAGTPGLAFGFTDSQGRYEFTNLANGAYVVYAQVPWMPYLDPCAWDAIAPSVGLDAAQPLGLVNIVLRKGVFLHIRMDDPAGAVRKQQAKAAGPVYLFHVLNRRGEGQWAQPIAEAPRESTCGRLFRRTWM